MKIAITGTIASGKSLVSKYLKTKGLKLIDCDQINAQLLEKNEAGYLEVIKEFDVLNEDLSIDKKKLADIVFNDNDKINILNNIMHPLIKEHIIDYMNHNDLAIVEVPLLFEVGWQNLFDETLLVCADEDIIIERLKNKGYSEKEAKLRIENQMSKEEKIKLAKHVIYNNGDVFSLYKKIDKWWNDIND